MLIGAQAYVWQQIYADRQQDFFDHLDEIFAGLSAAGIETFETWFPTLEHVERVRRVLAKHKLKMPTMYAGGKMHEPGWEGAVETIVAKARAAKSLGVSIVAVNPDPIAWGKLLDKTDAQLRTQAKALQAVGEKLNDEGMMLAYHMHDAELRCAGRELHHMMQGTDARVVGMCLDTHWVYRGAGDSEVALLDVIKMYLPRVRSLHLRQSRGGVWSECFGDGDVDYPTLLNLLQRNQFDGPAILEQCQEAGTPRELDPAERHRRSCEYLRRLLMGAGPESL